VDPIVRTLRLRAAELRRLAAVLDDAPLRTLGSAAAADTWVGPVADEFRLRLVELNHALDRASTELRHQALVLERQASAREAELLATGVAP